MELTPIERRVLGVLIEKGLTTPDQYPLTLNALVAGCNQKSNRDPITNYDEPQVDATLQSLIGKELVGNATGFAGRVERFSSQMGRRFELRSVEVAVIGELLLRGPQTEGELRIRASRMRPIADLAALTEILVKLQAATPPFVVRLSPEVQHRGVRYTHGLYPPAELKKLVAAEASFLPAEGEASATRTPQISNGSPDESSELRARIAVLESRVDALERRLPSQS
jgi:uncharacterized protein YceH (UPF0502 family)